MRRLGKVLISAIVVSALGAAPPPKVYYLTDRYGQAWYDRDSVNLRRWVDHVNARVVTQTPVYALPPVCRPGGT